VKEDRKEYDSKILLPLFLHCRSQQLVARNAARQNCSAGEQGAAFTKQQGALVCTFRPAPVLLCALLPLFLHCRSQQLIFRNAARQYCPAGEQGAAFTKQQGAQNNKVC